MLRRLYAIKVGYGDDETSINDDLLRSIFASQGEFEQELKGEEMPHSPTRLEEWGDRTRRASTADDDGGESTESEIANFYTADKRNLEPQSALALL
jgi:hypothetical protein